MLVAQSPCAVRCWWVIHRKGFRCWEVWKTDKIRLNIFLGVGSLRAWRWLSYMIKPWSHTSKTFMASWCCWSWLCVCVCAVCVPRGMHMCVHECTWVPVEVRGPCRVSLFSYFPPPFSSSICDWTWSLLICKTSRPMDPRFPPTSVSPHHWSFRCAAVPGFLCGYLESKLRSSSIANIKKTTTTTKTINWTISPDQILSSLWFIIKTSVPRF